MKKYVRYAQTAAATALAFGPVAALAQGGRFGNPEVPTTGQAVTTNTIIQFLEDIAQFLITASVIIAVIMIIYGGVVWMYQGADKGKEILKKGIIGVAIVLGVGVILSTVSQIVTTQSIGG